jgi:acyl carrier protein
LENKLKKVLSGILDIPVQEINLEQSRNEIPEWDSLAHVQIIVSVEQDFGVTIPFEDIDKIQSGNDFLPYLRK